MTGKSLGLIVAIFVVSQLASAAVYDGGSYTAKKIRENMDVTKLGPDLSPAPVGSDADRLSVAPVGQPFYAIGEDGKCYWSNFSKTNGKTAMVIYYQSPISTEHCVYQSTFAPKPSGFSISVKEGGRCVPSHVDVEGESYEWVLTQDGPAVDFATCFGPSTSYGDNIDRKHKAFDPAVASIEKPRIEEIKPQQEVKAEVATPPTPVAPAAPTVEVAASPRKPSSLEPPYTLQLASYLSLEEAKHAISSLKEKGVDAFTFSSVVSGTKRFRVCAGHFPTSKLARDFQVDLAKKTGITEGFVQRVSKSMEQSGANSLK